MSGWLVHRGPPKINLTWFNTKIKNREKSEWVAQDGLCVCVSVCLYFCVSLQGLQGSTLCAKIILFFLLCFFVFALSLFCFLLLLLLKKAAPGERGFRGRLAIWYRRSGGEGWGEREKDVGTRAACTFPWCYLCLAYQDRIIRHQKVLFQVPKAIAKNMDSEKYRRNWWIELGRNKTECVWKLDEAFQADGTKRKLHKFPNSL